MPLNEVEYEDILDPNYLQDLARRGREAVANAGPPDHRGRMQMMQNLQRTVQIERAHKNEIEQLAVETAKTLFPIIDKYGIEVTARLEDRIQVAAPERKPQGQIDPELLDAAKKRRIVNALTQGSAFSTHGVYHMVQDRLNAIDPNLVNLYTSINAGKQEDPFFFGDKNMLVNMAIQANRAQMADGYFNIEHNGDHYKINAVGRTFPILIHEITKGLYEIIGVEAYELDKEQNQKVNQYTDNVESEIDDFIKGRDIYSKVRDFIIDNHGDAFDQYPDFIAYFLQELYKLPAQQFVQTINGLLTGLPNRRLIQGIVQDVISDLRADDMDDALGN